MIAHLAQFVPYDMLFLALVNFACFVLAAPVAFDANKRTDGSTHPSSFSSLPSCSFLGSASVTQERFFSLAVTLSALGSMFFVSAVYATRRARLTVIGADDVPVSLVSKGVYAYVHHPFYSAYILKFLGIAITKYRSLQSWISIALIVALSWRAAISEERKFEGSPFATQYADYQRSTGMFLLRKRPSKILKLCAIVLAPRSII